MKLLQKELRALDLAIQALEEKRREYSPGHVAYTRDGIRADEINDKKVSGVGFAWAQEDHKKYLEYDQAINRLEDLKDILNDPGITREQEPLFDMENL